MWEYGALMHEHQMRLPDDAKPVDPITDEDFDEMLEQVRAMNLPDVDI